MYLHRKLRRSPGYVGEKSCSVFERCLGAASQRRAPGAAGPAHTLGVMSPMGQPGPGLRHPQREEVFPPVQLELPLLQFVAVAPCPVAGLSTYPFTFTSLFLLPAPLSIVLTSWITSSFQFSQLWLHVANLNIRCKAKILAFVA